MTIRRLFLFLLLACLALAGWGYSTAVADPLVREAEVTLAYWPEGQRPIRALLVAGPDMPPARLARIVERSRRFAPRSS